MPQTFSLTTLGCAKNQVDSDKLATHLQDEGFIETADDQSADVVVVNTCAFIDVAREESIEVILDLAARKAKGAKLVVTGCLAERYGQELAAELPEVDIVAGFGVDFTKNLQTTSLGPTIRRGKGALRKGAAPHLEELPAVVRDMDLLNLPRRPSRAPWAYVKAAEGCDKKCGFCAIPSFRGPQVSRPIDKILDEVKSLEIAEAVLVAQDLANYGRDRSEPDRLVDLYREVSRHVDWVRLLYLYPSELTPELIEEVASSPVPYFDLSLQHVSREHLRRMRRFGYGDLFLNRIESIRRINEASVFRSNFILGYPGETESDHLQLLEFLEEAQMDWVGFFAYSDEEGTYASTRQDKVDHSLALERLNEVSELQDRITRSKRQAQVGTRVRVLVDEAGVARSYREAPEIDGVITVDHDLPVGRFAEVEITESLGPDLIGRHLPSDRVVA